MCGWTNAGCEIRPHLAGRTQEAAREMGTGRKERAEYKRLSDELDTWIEGWQKAKQIREFVAAVEKFCAANNEPTSPDSPRGKWVVWALRRADAFDPLVADEDPE